MLYTLGFIVHLNICMNRNKQNFYSYWSNIENKEINEKLNIGSHNHFGVFNENHIMPITWVFFYGRAV